MLCFCIYKMRKEKLPTNIENIDLMPPDSIVVNTKTTNELKEDIQEEI